MSDSIWDEIVAGNESAPGNIVTATVDLLAPSDITTLLNMPGSQIIIIIK